MSRANGKPRGRPPYRHSKAALPKPGDEQCGDYSHARLVRMDNRFRARLSDLARSFANSLPVDVG